VRFHLLRFGSAAVVSFPVFVQTLSCDRKEQPTAASLQDASMMGVSAAVDSGVRIAVPEHAYALTLPDGWTRRPGVTNEPDVFSAANGSAQVTVTAMSTTAAMDDARRNETLAALVEHRRKADRAAMGPRMTAGEPRRTSLGAVVSARYEGVDVEASHRFATLVVVSSTGAWAVVYESSETSEKAFDAVENGVFASFDVAK
jgi:hypothetical protein